MRTASGAIDRFDHVVVATHADEALALLADPTPREKGVLGPWEYSVDDTWLHTDTRVLPRVGGHGVGDVRDPEGQRRTWYAGAYHRYGFHEDGLVSALRVAARFGIRWP